MSKKIKLILISIIFYLIGIVITFLMFKLWFALFKTGIILTIFIIITLIGAVKYFWGHTEWTIKNLKK